MLCFFSSCANYREIGAVADYPEFLREFKAFPESVPEVYQPPEIEGFTPLVNFGFEFAVPFFGEFAYCVYDEVMLLLSRDGKFYYAPVDLKGLDVTYDKFVFKQDGLSGIKSVFGETLVPAAYAKIQILGDAVAASDALGRTDVFKKAGAFYIKLHEKLVGELILFSDESLLYNHKLCDFFLTPITADGYAVMGASVNGMRPIMDNAGAFGYAQSDGGVAIPPQFSEAGTFIESNFAYVVDASGAYRIIDKAGESVYAQQNGMRPVRFDGTYITFLYEDGSFGVADGDFVPLTRERFVNLYDWSVFGDYLAVNTPDMPHRFYSLTENAYIGADYEFITPVCGYFLAKTPPGRYVLFDANLKTIAEAGYIAFDGDILLVGEGEKYHYYIA
ncbi:MAG: hypothetical protein FWD58_03570 [Firmicutes bacterium]|nr:hypothetical protein [Bacillota bacterium]